MRSPLKLIVIGALMAVLGLYLTIKNAPAPRRPAPTTVPATLPAPLPTTVASSPTQPAS